MLSIYSSFFNVHSMSFEWKAALANWLEFLGGGGQLVVVVNISTDDTLKLLREWVALYKLEHPMVHTSIDIIDAAISYDDPEFDGKLKALALSHCVQPYCILLDCDERVIPSQRRRWNELAAQLEKDPRTDGFLIPVVDLVHDDYHYKSIGSKWYLHRNSPNITRGVVQWAYKPDGSIDTTKSDTCELIYKDTRQLIRADHLVTPGFPHFMTASQLASGETPFVYHLGWLDKQQRLKQSAFWRPHWANRAKGGEEAAATLLELEGIRGYAHQLLSWKA